MTRLLTGMLYGVSTIDTVTFLGVAALLASVAFFECYIPARRAMCVDPMVGKLEKDRRVVMVHISGGVVRKNKTRPLSGILHQAIFMM